MRAKFCVDNNLEGIFYWDMVNDIKPTTATNNYSLAKYCNYGLASNVDTLVTEVDVRHITTAIKNVGSSASQQVEIRYDASQQAVIVAVPEAEEIRNIDVFSATGVKVRSARSSVVSMTSLPAGIYAVSVRLGNGQRASKTFVKK